MNKLVFLLPLSIILLLVVLQQWVGIANVGYVLLSMNPVYVPLAIALPFMTIMIYSVRWRMLLESVGIRAKTKVVFKYALIGMVFNNLTPMMRFGGEPVKGYLLAEEISASKKKVFASLFTDSIITLVSLLGIVYFSILGLMALNVLNATMTWMLFILVFVPIGIGAYILYNKRLLILIAEKVSRLTGKLRPGYGKNLPKDIVKFREIMKESVRRRDILAKSTAIAFAERIFEISSLYFILLSLGVDISIFSCTLVMGVGILAGNIPLLPGGLVAYESSTIFVLGLMGVPTVTATSAILVWRFASYWLMTFAGLVASWMYGVKFSLGKRNTFKLGA